MIPVSPRESADDIALLSRRHLERVVAIDTQCDDASDTIPSTPGQARLADDVATFFAETGASIERDAHANVIASFPGRGTGAGKPPLALMVHLDTTPGTIPVPHLELLPAWDGRPVPYPANPHVVVDIVTYPAAREFLGQDLLYGPGDRPFGLDDKLGLAHLMTLAALLRSNPAIPHPPLMLIARPDEEIGRMAAVVGVASLLKERGVDFGYTLDGFVPFEVNVENFNASDAVVTFPTRPPHVVPGHPETKIVRVALGGVNTHGCTAKAEGHRNAVRFAAEILAGLGRAGVAPRWVVPHSVLSDPYREVDATATFLLGGPEFEALAALEQALSEVIGPHEKRGASWSIDAPVPYDPAEPGDHAAGEALRFVQRFLLSRPGFPLAAEDSEGREGYSNPYRLVRSADGLRLHVRLRDFDADGLAAREEHVRKVAQDFDVASVAVRPQYVNMGRRLAERGDIVDHARHAAAAVGITARVLPIRGGTGVDPFLDRGIPIANLGTGYFAPESEKEFTSLQLMARHALWLTSLVQHV